MGYDNYCENCPYKNQIHLEENYRTIRDSPPIELENNKSDILLVFQSPGIEEWKTGEAIEPTIKKGGTAGRRIKLSWDRKNKKRTDFDIINTVQCFPGNDKKRDFKPNIMSICSCSKRLENVLSNSKYNKVILFGEIAENVVENLINKLNLKIKIVKSKHPTGGLANKNLDNLW